MNLKKQEGVTLLALAITIAVIFILVGTSVGMIVSEKGLLKSGKEVQNTQKNYAQAEEDKTNELIDSVGKVTKVEVESIKSNWEVINKIAKAIAEGRGEDENGKAVSSNSNQATVEIADKSYTIKVGNEFEVTYDGVARRVRVLGFKHDELTNPTEAYGSGTKATRAGISFEFLDCLMDSSAIHSSNDNTNGWVTKSIYTTLNNTTDGKYKELQNTGISIKQVQKTYNAPATTGANNPQTSSDYLWLLSCTEIWGDSAYTGCVSAYSTAKEGEQYVFYSNCIPKPVYNVENTNVVHYNSTGKIANICWLRSPSSNLANGFCNAYTNGNCTNSNASANRGVAPGFAI